MDKGQARALLNGLRSVNLPDDVFEAGEAKPQKKSARGTLNGKKRGPSEVFIHHHEPTLFRMSKCSSAGKRPSNG